MDSMINYKTMPILLIMTFFMITFLQSAIDKIIDWKGNLGFLNGHFKNSIVTKQVPIMLACLTIVEFLSGFFCLYALVRIFISPTLLPVVCALSMCGINLLMLLFGQRLAKDYAGAATMGNYMTMVLIGFVFMFFANIP